MHSILGYSYNNNLEQLKRELESGAPIDEREPQFQMAPLHLANCKRHLEAVKLLLDYNADIYAKDTSNRTALDIATTLLSEANNDNEINDSLEIIKLLLFKEVELRLQGKYTNKPFLKNIKSNFNLTPGDHLNSKPELKKGFIELTKKAENIIAQGKLIEVTSSTTKIVSDLRNRKQDTSILAKHVPLESEDSQNTDPNSSMPSKDSWLPSIFQSIFGSSLASEEKEALLKHEKKSPKNN